MAKKKTKKKDPAPTEATVNVLDEMNKLPTLDLLRICLTGLAVLHERAVTIAPNEEADIPSEEPSKLITPTLA